MPFDFNTFKQNFDSLSADIDEQLKLVDSAIEEIDKTIYSDLEKFHNDIGSVMETVTDLRPFILPFVSFGRVGQQGGVGIENNIITPKSFEDSSKSNLDRAKLLEQNKDLLIAHGFEIEALARELISLAKTNLYADESNNRTDFFNGEGFEQIGYAEGYTEAQKEYRDYLLDCISKLSASNTDIIVYPNPSSGKVTIGCPKYRYDYTSIHRSVGLAGVSVVLPDGSIVVKLDYDYQNASYNTKAGLPILVNTGAVGDNESEIQNIQVVDAQGKNTDILASEDIYPEGGTWVTDYVEVKLDLSHLAKGVYFINIDGMGFTKVVIQH